MFTNNLGDPWGGAHTCVVAAMEGMDYRKFRTDSRDYVTVEMLGNSSFCISRGEQWALYKRGALFQFYDGCEVHEKHSYFFNHLEQSTMDEMLSHVTVDNAIGPFSRSETASRLAALGYFEGSDTTLPRHLRDVSSSIVGNQAVVETTKSAVVEEDSEKLSVRRRKEVPKKKPADKSDKKPTSKVTQTKSGPTDSAGGTDDARPLSNRDSQRTPESASPVEEIVVEPEILIGVRPEGRRHADLIERLGGVGALGDEADLALLDQLLSLIPAHYLDELISHNYKVVVSRNDCTGGDVRSNGRVNGATPVKFSPTIHLSTPPDRKILVRTWMEGGKPVLDIGAVLRCLGEAVCERFYEGMGQTIAPPFLPVASGAHQPTPPAKPGNFSDVYQIECAAGASQGNLSKEEFFGEVFALWSLRPEQLAARFPIAAEYLSQHERTTGERCSVDRGKLGAFQRAMYAKPAQSSDPTTTEVVDLVEDFNTQRVKARNTPESWVLTIDGEAESVREIATDIGRELLLKRCNRAPLDADEGCVTVDAALAANSADLFKRLVTTCGAVLFIPEPDAVPLSSDFWAEYKKFNGYKPGQCHILLGGSEASREAFKDLLPAAPRKHIVVSMLNQSQLREKISQYATNEGYLCTNFALDTLGKQLPAMGTIDNAKNIWRRIKATYMRSITAAHTPDSSGASTTQLPQNAIRQSHIHDTDFGLPKSAYESLKSRNIPTELMEYVDNLIRSRQLASEQVAAGAQRVQKLSPIRLLLAGNPGVGKTTNARFIAGALFEKGLVQSSTFLELSTSNLMDLSTPQILKKLEEGFKGTIFIDEFHQADPSASAGGARTGKDLLNCIIPLLTSEAWADTAFIFAGYPRELKDMMQADQGLRRRLTRFDLRDFTSEELRSIAGDHLKEVGYTITDEAFELLMEKITDLQRSSPHPGNAGDVISTIDGDIIPRQNARILKSEGLSGDASFEITVDDIGLVRPETPEEILKEFDQKIQGNEQIKDFLLDVLDQVQVNRQYGDPLTTDVPFAIALDGPPGTGKTTLFAPLFGRFYRALGLLSRADCEVRQGGDLVGAYVGNWSANAVKDLFDKAWGGVGVIDEASAIDTAVEFTDQSIKAMLPRLEQKTCLIVAADYAHKMDQFLGLDAGLAGRFRRVSTKAFSPQAAFFCLTKELAAKRVDTSSLDRARVELALELLVQLPGFANGRDIVKTMAPEIATCHRKATRGSPGAALSTEVILSYLEDFTQQVASRTKASLSAARGELSFARQRKVAVPPPPEQVKTAPTRELIQQAIQKVDASFADLANSDPARFKQLLSDPSSEYYQELGKELGTSSTEAHSSMKKEIALQVVELESTQKTLSPSKQIRFDYYCPFCGGVNSPDCYYFSNSETVNPSSFEFSKEWLLAHSLKEPYEVEAQ